MQKVPKTTSFVTTLRLLTVALGVSMPLAAWAEVSNESMIGPGLRWRPVYDGSDARRTEFVPVVRYLGEPLFIRSTQGVLEGGARIQIAPGLHVGAQLAYEGGRNPNDSDFLRTRNVSGLNPGASVGLHLEWDHKIGPVPITLLTRVRRHTESDRGTQADVRLSVGVFRSGPVSAGLFVQETWADGKSTAVMYGVTPQQSAASGLPVFNPGSGGEIGSAGVLWSVDLAKQWLIVGNLEARRLQGDAAHSPLVERKSSYQISTGIAYRF